MDVVTIISIIAAAVVGLFLGKLVFTKNNPSNTVAPQVVSDENEKNKKQLEETKSAIASSEQKIKEIKNKYEALLLEANKKVQDLDEQLKLAVDSKTYESIKNQLEEVDNLKKKIKNLEDENEEFEDDLDSYKKRLKSKEQNLSDLQIEFEKLSRERKQLQEELQSVSNQLDSKVKELNLKMESLSFVQEVLSAKKTSDESIIKIHSMIDNICDSISNELKDLIINKSVLEEEKRDYLFKSGLTSWSINAKKSWIQGKTSIAFVGDFSAGKTSIVNRILSQDDPNIPLLPVSTKATTAIPTYISGGVGTLYQFVTPNNEIKSISESTFKRVNKEVLDQVKGVSSLIQFFVMTYKNANLDRFSILDTPGFSSNDKEDAERTIAVINECDALFWVSDVNAGPLNRSSIELINKHLTKPLYVVINKVDTKAESEVDKVEELIRKSLSDAGQKVEDIIRFSAKAPLEDIMTPIKSIKHDASKENYIETLLDSLNKCISDKLKDVSNAKSIVKDLNNKFNSIKDQYNTAIDDMSVDCIEVGLIPKHNPQHGLFNMKKPNYDMSEEDYNEMINILGKIADTNLPLLDELNEKMIDVSAQLENAWREHAEKSAQYQQLNKYKDTLNRKIKGLNNK